MNASIVNDSTTPYSESQDFSEKREQSNLSAYKLSEFVSMSDELLEQKRIAEANANELNNLTELYEYIANDKDVTSDEIYRRAYTIAEKVFKNASVSTRDEYDDLVNISYKKITEATDTIQGNSQVSRREASVENDTTTLSSESQDFTEKRDRYEAKQRYVDRRNAESRENAIGLSEEQTDTLEWLARTRHEIHSSPERFRNPEAGGTTWNYFDDDSLESINNHLTSAGLEPIDFGDYTDIPTADDYYSILSDEEREEWESYVEENGYDSRLSAWIDNSGDYETFVRAMERINKSMG